MQKCWTYAAAERPTFSALVRAISESLEETSGYFILSSPPTSQISSLLGDVRTSVLIDRSRSPTATDQDMESNSSENSVTRQRKLDLEQELDLNFEPELTVLGNGLAGHDLEPDSHAA
jgi:hypothetical protein